MVCTYNKKVKSCPFEVGDKVLKRIFLVQEEAKRKFTPNWQRPLIIKRALPRTLILMKMDGQVFS